MWRSIIAPAVAGFIGVICAITVPNNATALPVTVPDFSFELQTTNSSGFCFGACITGAWSGTNVSGILDASIIDISGPGALPSPLPHGNKTVFDNQPNGGIAQTLAHTLLANTRYTLQVDAAYWLNNPQAAFPELRLLSGNTDLLLGSAPVTASAAQWLTQTMIIDIGATHAALGHPLKILLASGCPPGCPPGTPVQQIWWDNVRLDASPLTPRPPGIPEPSTLALLFLGIVGLGFKRKKA